MGLSQLPTFWGKSMSVRFEAMACEADLMSQTHVEYSLPTWVNFLELHAPIWVRYDRLLQTNAKTPNWIMDHKKLCQAILQQKAGEQRQPQLAEKMVQGHVHTPSKCHTILPTHHCLYNVVNIMASPCSSIHWCGQRKLQTEPGHKCTWCIIDSSKNLYEEQMHRYTAFSPTYLPCRGSIMDGARTLPTGSERRRKTRKTFCGWRTWQKSHPNTKSEQECVSPAADNSQHCQNGMYMHKYMESRVGGACPWVAP